MNVPKELKYTESHEWIRLDGDDIVTVGVTDYAQNEMTELVYVELPDVGGQFSAKDEIAVVESVKSASDIYAPVSGEVVEVNAAVADDAATVNNSPFDEGWLFKLKLTNPSELQHLMAADDYLDKIS
ncbi:MAG: glycine cleavage system protein GcvH [Fuerstiella sp.]|nr:glycine cleavage system protein GcvH [Fuerstiella sp.]MCP4854239.1 glycine cleavage system protein GcvH [Fuerstiella sp.]